MVGAGGPGMGGSVSKRQIKPSETQRSTLQQSPFKKDKRGFQPKPVENRSPSPNN